MAKKSMLFGKAKAAMGMSKNRKPSSKAPMKAAMKTVSAMTPSASTKAGKY